LTASRYAGKKLVNMARSGSAYDYQLKKTTAGEKLEKLLDFDFNFHKEKSSYGTHSLHSFPAKFPPQLPAFFIENLTEPGDVVLDPMAGSGTTLIEAVLRNRYAIGVDIDPLAVQLCRVKTSSIGNPRFLVEVIDEVVYESIGLLEHSDLESELNSFFDEKTREFVNYWFRLETQKELYAIIAAIDKFTKIIKSKYKRAIKDFLFLCVSSIIIRKSGGVSLALDLAHSRPHRYMDKKIPSAIIAFKERARKAVPLFAANNAHAKFSKVFLGDARDLSNQIRDQEIDLIVTSPPYSNAIDYVRANKFSLVWLGYPISELSDLRSRYLGSEKAINTGTLYLPLRVKKVVSQIEIRDKKKAKMLIRYFSEMKAVIKEMYRVLKSDAAAVIVVGSSLIKDVDTQIQRCLAEVAMQDDVGFELIGVKARALDRNRRMMPKRNSGKNHSQIEKRIDQEFVILLRKP